VIRSGIAFVQKWRPLLVTTIKQELRSWREDEAVAQELQA